MRHLMGQYNYGDTTTRKERAQTIIICHRNFSATDI